MLLLPLNPKAPRLLGMLLLAFGLLCPRCALAWGGGSAKHDRVHEVQQIEQQWRSAVLASDTAAMDRMLADDYVSLTLQDKVNTKAQQLRRMRDRLLVLEQLDLSEIKVRVLGNVALVTGRARVLGRSGTHTLDGLYRYSQVLRLQPAGNWVIMSFEAHHEAVHGLRVQTLQHAPRAG